MSDPFFTDRTGHPRPRYESIIDVPTWAGIAALIEQRINGNWLAEEFPLPCPDGNGVVGTYRRNLFDLLEALVGDLSFPFVRDRVPPTGAILDLLDFVGQRVSKPKQESYHSFFQHYELSFERKKGRSEFRHELNGLLARRGIAFEMSPAMKIIRLGPPEARPLLADLRPDTGDEVLDELIRGARARYLSRDAGEERIAIEKLWDAFERLKTIEPGKDKKAQSLPCSIVPPVRPCERPSKMSRPS